MNIRSKQLLMATVSTVLMSHMSERAIADDLLSSTGVTSTVAGTAAGGVSGALLLTTGAATVLAGFLPHSCGLGKNLSHLKSGEVFLCILNVYASADEAVIDSAKGALIQIAAGSEPQNKLIDLALQDLQNSEAASGNPISMQEAAVIMYKQIGIVAGGKVGVDSDAAQDGVAVIDGQIQNGKISATDAQ